MAALECVDGSCGGFSQERLELCEDLLDRIEVRRVGREEHQCRSGPFDCRPGVRGLVGGEIVHDHDVAGVQRRREGGSRHRR